MNMGFHSKRPCLVAPFVVVLTQQIGSDRSNSGHAVNVTASR